jgi:hypothetical protein
MKTVLDSVARRTEGREIWRHIGKLTEDDVISRLGINATP